MGKDPGVKGEHRAEGQLLLILTLPLNELHLCYMLGPLPEEML